MSAYSFSSSFSIGEWQAYTVSWTATGTAPSFGNAVVNGWFAGQGQVMMVQVHVTMGSTTTYGTGEWIFGLPPGVFTDPNIHPGGAAVLQLGTCVAIDSGTALKMGTPYFTGTQLSILEDNASGWGNTSPHTWAVNDNFSLSGIFKVTV